MTYDDIAAIFLAPLDEPIPEPSVDPTVARRLRDAVEPIATQGWWSRAAGERLMALGVDFFPGYVWGRAAALGEPLPSLVAATFGVFEPMLISGVYEAGVAAASRIEILDARSAGAVESIAAVAEPAECEAIAEPLLAALDELDVLGRPLFAALRSIERPEAPAGRLWRAGELVREHRGDGHLAVLVAAGLGPIEANVLTELWLGYSPGEYSGTRGFGPDALESAIGGLQRRGWMQDHQLTDAGRAARDDLEAATDAAEQRLVEACGSDLETIIAGCQVISSRLIEARCFPADPRKLAAG